MLLYLYDDEGSLCPIPFDLMSEKVMMSTFTYDVFLSFTGMDTRWGFTGNLYDTLDGRRIRTFIDDKELKKGLEELTPALSKAIQESRTAIVVLSPNYAFSSFCLNELATILDCFHDKKIKRVFPVFYGVDPSDVRHQRGSYGEAFATHQKQFMDDKNKFNDYNEKLKFNQKLTKWENALRKAANLPGFTYKHGDTYEYEFIRRILKEVSTVIGREFLHVTEYPVGLEPRVKKVKSLLNVESEIDDYMVGIQGIGGLGKSTIARAVYNEICHHFEGLCCFLSDVRVKSVKHGLAHLQKTILSVIHRGKHISIQDEHEGKSKLENMLKKKKVLLVLDDVDQIEQLKALVGGCHWFGSGSRVIITTREERLLTLHGVKKIYTMQGLSDKEALQLLSWNAFKSKETKPGYRYILKRAITYASGLPLALEVIGSNLFGKDVDVCNSILDGYGNSLHKKIQDKLRISFDSLSIEEQTVFLDIACCFRGYKLSEVESILDAHYGSSMKPRIEILIEKSLIKIDDGVLTLHTLIQEMGREIAREESREPSQRSRLWYYHDVVQVLKENVGSSKTEMLVLDFPKDGAQLKGPEGDEVPSELDGQAIQKMENLKTLIIRNGQFSKVPTHFPRRLRVLKWWGYPSSSLPPYFHPQSLSILELPESSFKQCEPIQMLQYLTVLDFSYNECITEIPDVSGVPKLKKLSLEHCTSLTKIHDSVGFLDKLTILDAGSCKKLDTFPPIRMTCLEQFNLSNCTLLESFPEILGKMENVTELHIIGSPIKELPFSIHNLTRLQKLEVQLGGTVSIPSSIVMLQELGTICVSKCKGFQLSELDKSEKMVSKYSNTECLNLSSCNISDTILPKALTLFAKVKDLNLSGNNFKVLDACFKECHLLRNLKLDDCGSLTKVIGIPVKLETLSMKGCKALEFLDLTVLPACTEGYHFLKELVLDDCVFLQDVRGILSNLDHLSAKNCISLTASCTSLLLDQEWIGTGNKMFFLPGTKIPGWFSYHTKGGSMSFKFRNKFPSISLCLVIEVVNQQSITMEFSPKVFINGKSLGIQNLYKLETKTNHVFLFRVPLSKFEDNVDVVFPDGKWNTVDISYADHITYDDVQGARYSGIHVSKTSCMGDIKFSNHVKPMKNVTFDPNSEGPSESITTKRPQKEHNMVLSALTFTSIQPLPTEDERGLTSRPALPIESDVEEETSDSLPEDEVLPTTVQHDLPVIERSSCELESNSTDSDSDDPFNFVNEKLCFSGKETMSLGDASLVSVRKAIDALELLMIKDLSEVSSDPAMQSQLKHLLNLVTTSSHRKVTVEVKEALDKFRRKAFESFQEFQATIEPVNKMKNFEKQKAGIVEETSAGKYRWKDFRSSIKKTSSAIKAQKSRKEEIESKIANIRNQINNKEMDLEQLVLNVKNQEATLSTYPKNRDSLIEQARALSKEADDLLASNKGIEDEGKAAEVNQIMLKSTWSTDLPSQLNKIKINIFSL